MNKHNHDHDNHSHHLTPIGVFVKVFVALIGLTVLTVVTSLYNFGILNIYIAMFIACTKALLVVIYFMQLKYDNTLNRVTFAMSILFVIIFILITASDLFFRSNPQPVKVVKAAGADDDSPAAQNKYRMHTPELLAQGKKLYEVQCATCHGPAGKGDGAAAAALNPKPRNFTEGYWKFGGSPTKVFATITKGSPGTAMASYSNLTTQDRYALAHYVRSLSPNAPADTEADLKTAGLTGGAKVAAKPKVKLDIEKAMELLSDRDQVVIPEEREFNPTHPGAKIFKSACINCHGMNAAGMAVMAAGVNPTVNVITKAWSGIKASWVSDSGAFKKWVAEGLPGKLMPAHPNFSAQEWSDLHSYARALATR